MPLITIFVVKNQTHLLLAMEQLLLMLVSDTMSIHVLWLLLRQQSQHLVQMVIVHGKGIMHGAMAEAGLLVGILALGRKLSSK
jgi:hypothetical protein